MMQRGGPAFAEDPGTRRYYDRRAPEYDDWYLGEGLFAERDRPGWQEELSAVCSVLAALEPATTLDIACGTGFLSRHLAGRVLGLDRSPAMARLAKERIGAAGVADALAMPVADHAVARVFAGHFYGHLPPGERARFLQEVRRVAQELVVVDSAPRPGEPPESWQERVLNDGSRHVVFKRFVSAGQVATEIAGTPLFDGRWFVIARAAVAHAPRP